MKRLFLYLKQCFGKIGSLVDLVEGKLSDPIVELLCDRDSGLFPEPDEIHLNCDCPDWADLCKHLAAVLYGIGARLDDDPALFFVLRGVDQSELFSGDLGENLPGAAVDLDDLADTFGIELD